MPQAAAASAAETVPGRAPLKARTVVRTLVGVFGLGVALLLSLFA